MSQTAIDLLEQGTAANREHSLRRGNVIHLPATGSLIVSGDLHGHRRNFERIANCADLASHSDRHVLLQEIIHGGPEDGHGGCLSYHLIFDAIRYQLDFPDRVHIILGNHDTAFFCDTEVMKDGREMNRAVHQAMEREYGPAWTAVQNALNEYLLSLPLAVRSANRIWMSHSLPADRLVDQFDPGILDRPFSREDCQKPGSVYILTWGRRMSQAVLDRMAKVFDVDLFILGHQAQPDGWAQAGDNLVILASDHNHGCILPLDLSRTYTIDELPRALLPLSALT